jgi:hypothetical protein
MGQAMLARLDNFAVFSWALICPACVRRLANALPMVCSRGCICRTLIWFPDHKV